VKYNLIDCDGKVLLWKSDFEHLAAIEQNARDKIAQLELESPHDYDAQLMLKSYIRALKWVIGEAEF